MEQNGGRHNAGMPRTTADAESAPALQLQPAGLSQVVGFQLAKAELLTRDIFFRHAGEPLGVRPVEYAALAVVAANPDSSQRRLGNALSLTPPNTTALVARLEGKGWIERSSSTQDRRSQALRITKAGAALVREATKRITAAEQAELKLSPGEQAILLELLQKVALSRRHAD
jgi:DNA-binding MarR family transcriptional regulator